MINITGITPHFLDQPTATILTQLVHVPEQGIFGLTRTGFDVVKDPSVFWRLSTL